jgi:hypothetical protein
MNPLALEMTMTTDTKKPKADTAPKPKADTAPKNDTAAKVESTAADGAPKPEGGETAAKAPSNYNRGEGQKPVTAAYKENWNAIFAKKRTKKKKR